VRVWLIYCSSGSTILFRHYSEWTYSSALTNVFIKRSRLIGHERTELKLHSTHHLS
jgi:hypothetical protein